MLLLHLTNQPTNEPTNQPTNSMEKTTFREGNSHSTNQEITCLLCVLNCPPLVPVLNHMNPVQTFPPGFPKIYFNIILPSTLRSSEFSYVLGFPKIRIHFPLPKSLQRNRSIPRPFVTFRNQLPLLWGTVSSSLNSKSGGPPLVHLLFQILNTTLMLHCYLFVNSEYSAVIYCSYTKSYMRAVCVCPSHDSAANTK
jgi:hypothetical protein